MKQLLATLFVALCTFWLSSERAYAYCSTFWANGQPAGYICDNYLNTPNVPPFSMPYSSVLPLEYQQDIFHFYKPICHYAPGVWGWQWECAY
jgi:hypothetical protein